MTGPRSLKDPIAAFWKKVDKTPYCWEWTGAVDGGGYGVVTRDGRMRKAHRYAWELAHGPVPEGLILCHRCDNRRCVRVSHVSLGTHADNSADMRTKGRSKRGVDLSHTKLDKFKVREIRARGALVTERPRPRGTLTDLAKEFGVTNHAIWSILERKSWAYL